MGDLALYDDSEGCQNKAVGLYYSSLFSKASRLLQVCIRIKDAAGYNAEALLCLRICRVAKAGEAFLDSRLSQERDQVAL